MSKWLSYERSKRLAELGYKPEINQVNQWYTFRGTFMQYLTEDWQLDNEPIERLPGKPPILAPDCHDFLMELEGKIDIVCKGGKHCVRLFPNEQDHGVIFYDDPPLLEALGEALINFLEWEEENNGR